MKHSPARTLIPPILLLLVLVLSACSPKAAPEPASTVPKGTVLKLIAPNGGHALTLDDLKSLPVTEGMAGMKSSTGKITIPEKYTGVALKDLLAHYDIPLDASMGLTLTASDGYSMTFSYDQVMNGDFIAYDPALGNELKDHDPLTAIIAYGKDGKPLDPNEEGVLRLTVVSATNNEVVDGHWTVKWINQVEVKSSGQDWTLHLHGAISQPIDRATYQSCGSPSCHGTAWVDENGQNWVGVPLWLLVGEVDDSNSHEDNAYNDALAKAGYTVEITSSDGSMVTLASELIQRNNNFLVAAQVNDAELPGHYYPLRLVGSGLQNDQMIGKLEMIQLNLAAIPTPTLVASAANSDRALLITGMVDQELSLSDSDLHTMQVATISAQPPKGTAAQEYTGMRLNDLFAKAGIKPGAVTVTFTASDGYAADVSLADIRACADCLLAFSENAGNYFTVMPGMLGNNWTKNVIKIEVK
jgi:DMSO/TMAO reductase YedYZ molybdopterin-dependent catalytic subunit